jgi:D-psicose/D-tagatose/L-ribulose 3-epimerase
MSESSLRYAIHAYAWTSSWSNEHLAIFDHARDLGLDAVEVPLMELDLIDPPAIAERAREVGLDVVASVAVDAAHDPSSEDEGVRRAARDFLVRCVDLAAAMGSPFVTGVVYSAMGRRIDRRPDAGDMERAAGVLRDVARHAADHGVTIGIEPINRYETFLVNTQAQAQELRELIGEPNVGIHLDAYHMNIEEEDFHGPTLAAAPHLVHYHLSESHRGVPGRGTVDWAAIMLGLAEGGYRGYVGLEAFVDISDAMKGATCIWRNLAPSSDVIVREGLAFLRKAEADAYAAVAGAAR